MRIYTFDMKMYPVLWHAFYGRSSQTSSCLCYTLSRDMAHNLHALFWFWQFLFVILHANCIHLYAWHSKLMFFILWFISTLDSSYVYMIIMGYHESREVRMKVINCIRKRYHMTCMFVVINTNAWWICIMVFQFKCSKSVRVEEFFYVDLNNIIECTFNWVHQCPFYVNL